MPWTVDDVDRHKAGLSARQKRVWVRVANSALKACLARNGSQSECEGSAIKQANAVAGKVAPTANQASRSLLITQNVRTGFEIRYEVLNDCTYIVAPVVPIVEGILNGYLVRKEDIAACLEAWNAAPVPIGHPTNDYGEYISARSPSILEQTPGLFMNARMDDTRMLGEVWLNIAKCEQLGGKALECLHRVEAGHSIECSTAFWPETVMEAGTFNGQPFVGIHRHLRPDHLALLPDDIGACSIAGGCGVRAHAGQQHACQCHATASASRPCPPHTEAIMPPDTHGRFKTAIHSILAFATGGSPERGTEESLAVHLTHDDIALALCSLLCEKLGRNMEMMYGPSMIVDVQDGFAIYKDAGELYRHAYTVDDAGVVALTGEPEDVQRNTQYLPMVGNAAHQPGGVASQQTEGDAMTPKAELVRALIAHQQTIWEEKDRTTLEACADEFLARLVAEADTRTPAPATQTTTQEAGQAAATTPAAVTTQAPQAAPVTLEAITQLLRTELDVRDQALEGKLAAFSQQQAEQTERAQLVGLLAVEGWTEAECAGMPLVALRKLAQTVAPVSYAGQGFPAFPGSAANDDDLPDDAPKGWDN